MSGTPLRSDASEEEEWAAGFETYAGLESDAVPSRGETARGPRFRPARGLAMAVTLLLALAAAAALHGLVADIDAFRLAGRPLSFAADGADASALLTTARDGHRAADSLQLWTMTATACVFVTWFHRIRTNVDAMDPLACSTGRGWAIGVWFVPLVNLVMPWLIAREVTYASAGRTSEDAAHRQDPEHKPSLALLNAWWAAWVASKVLLVIGSRLPVAGDEAASVHRASTVWISVDVLNVAAAILAALYVRRLTRLQQCGYERLTSAPTSQAG